MEFWYYCVKYENPVEFTDTKQPLFLNGIDFSKASKSTVLIQKRTKVIWAQPSPKHVTHRVTPQHRCHEVSVSVTDSEKQHPWECLGISTPLFFPCSNWCDDCSLNSPLKTGNSDTYPPILYLISRKKYWVWITIFHQHSLSFPSDWKHTKSVYNFHEESKLSWTACSIFHLSKNTPMWKRKACSNTD